MKKNSFVVYGEYLKYFDKLPLIEKGKLIDAMLRFSQDLPVEEQLKEMEASTEMAFMFISNQMSLDAEKYDRRCETSKLNGSKGGAPKGNKNAKKEEEKQPKQPKINLKSTKNKPNDNENDNDNDSKKENKKEKNKKTCTILKDGELETLTNEMLFDKEVIEKFLLYAQMRESQGKNKAIRTKELLEYCINRLRNLAKNKQEALAVLDNSINNQYTGLFALKNSVKVDAEDIPYAN